MAPRNARNRQLAAILALAFLMVAANSVLALRQGAPTLLFMLGNAPVLALLVIAWFPSSARPIVELFSRFVLAVTRKERTESMNAPEQREMTARTDDESDE